MSNPFKMSDENIKKTNFPPSWKIRRNSFCFRCVANKLHLVTKTKGTSFVCQNASLNIIGLPPWYSSHFHKPQRNLSKQLPRAWLFRYFSWYLSLVWLSKNLFQIKDCKRNLIQFSVEGEIFVWKEGLDCSLQIYCCRCLILLPT